MVFSLYQRASVVRKYNQFSCKSNDWFGAKRSHKKTCYHLISLTAEESSKQVSKPRFRLGYKVRIAKQDLPFKKGYKQNFTDEIFRITKVTTFNPPTYSLADIDGDDIAGKFYEQELVRVQQ